MTIDVAKSKTDIELRDYQQEAIGFLNDNQGKLVLAMCPSSGKTINNPNKKNLLVIFEQFKKNKNYE
jgi:hypothetical protein